MACKKAQFRRRKLSTSRKRFAWQCKKPKGKKNKKLERDCLGSECKNKFTTTNPFRRLCKTCRKKSIYESGY